MEDPPPQIGAAPAQKKGRARWWLALVIASCLAVTLGGYGGMSLGRMWGSIANGPTDAPTAAADFPNVRDRYLQGVTVSAIARDWLAGRRSWKCEINKSSKPSVREAGKRTGCSPRGKGAEDLKVTIQYDEENRVRSVNLLCAQGPGDRICRELFSDMAGVVMARDERLRKQAVDWVTANVDSDESTVIGTTRMAATLFPHYLDFTPAG